MDINVIIMRAPPPPRACVVIKSFCQRLKVKVGLWWMRCARCAPPVAQRARVLHIWSIPVALFCECRAQHYTYIHTHSAPKENERGVRPFYLIMLAAAELLLYVFAQPPPLPPYNKERPTEPNNRAAPQNGRHNSWIIAIKRLIYFCAALIHTSSSFIGAFNNHTTCFDCM